MNDKERLHAIVYGTWHRLNKTYPELWITATDISAHLSSEGFPMHQFDRTKGQSVSLIMRDVYKSNYYQIERRHNIKNPKLHPDSGILRSMAGYRRRSPALHYGDPNPDMQRNKIKNIKIAEPATAADQQPRLSQRLANIESKLDEILEYLTHPKLGVTKQDANPLENGLWM